MKFLEPLQHYGNTSPELSPNNYIMLKEYAVKGIKKTVLQVYMIKAVNIKKTHTLNKG